MEFSEAEKKFLDEQQIGRLATVSPKNRAQVTPIIFVLHEGNFYFTTLGSTVKFANMKSNPNVGFVVDIYEDGGRSRKAVAVQGVAEEILDEPEFGTAVKLLTDKLPYYKRNPIVKGTNHTFRITPDHKASWGFQ